MKDLHILHFFIIIFSCKNSRKEALDFDLNGIWYGDQIFLIQDSVMTNPFWESYGFFYYSIKYDTLILEDSDLESSGKIEFIDKNHFYLIASNQNNDTLRFEKITKINSIKFELMFFEGGSLEGKLPFFKMQIDKYGLVT